jgi:DNA-binding transcriptional ArsR family regulator
MDSEDTVLVMVHKRIRKRESYDIDSNEIIEALEKNGYPMEEPEVMGALAALKEAGYLRAYEDIEESGGKSRVTRYWGLEITPEGAMRAIDLMNQFRYGAQ